MRFEAVESEKEKLGNEISHFGVVLVDQELNQNRRSFSHCRKLSALASNVPGFFNEREIVKQTVSAITIQNNADWKSVSQAKKKENTEMTLIPI